MTLKFEWDEEKRQLNLKKHNVDFVRACEIFQNFTVEYEDNRYNYNEERYVAIGQTNEQIFTVVYTWRGEIIRLISARKANKNEREIYYESYN